MLFSFADIQERLVEDEAEQQNDEKIDQEKAAAGPRSNWPVASLTR
jgi:hypothetical protein